MLTARPATKWIRKRKWYFILGVPLLWFILAPFSLFGCGMIYPIVDTLRGHPEGPHGTHPARFAGMWIRDKVIEYDFLGQAFYLMPSGRLAGMMGLTERRWHFDDDRLYVDAVSRCGNGYQGNVTTTYKVKFVGDDQIVVANEGKDATRGIQGTYRRVRIDAGKKAELTQLAKADGAEGFRSRMVLQAIESFEILSKLKD